MNTPDNIWLIYQGADGVVWSDSPSPAPDIQPEDICGYIRADKVGAELSQSVMDKLQVIPLPERGLVVIEGSYYKTNLALMACRLAARQILPLDMKILMKDKAVSISVLDDEHLKMSGVCHISELSEAKGENSRLNSELFQLREKLKLTEQVLREAPELNMSNYHHDQVSELNRAVIEAYGILVSE